MYLRVRLPASRLFDAEFYAAQRGREFRNNRAALRDFLREARTSPYAPNPLFEAQWIVGSPVRSTLPQLRSYLRHGKARRGTSPLFDEVSYLEANPAAAGHRGRGLGHFLATAGTGTVLPVPRGGSAMSPTWGSARAALMQAAVTFADGQRLTDESARRGLRASDEAALRRELSGAASVADRTVSVILTAHDRAPLVRAAIDSVLGQSHTACELVVVLDAPDPDTASLVASAAELEARIRVVTGPAAGVGAARNAGLQAATGEFVAFLDGDYSLDPEFVRRMVTFLTVHELEAAVAASEMPQPEGRAIVSWRPTAAELRYGASVDLNALLARRETVVGVGGFDEAIPRWGHLDFFLRLCAATEIGHAAFVGAVGADRDDTGTQRASDHWFWVVLGKHVIDWDGVRSALPDRVPGRVSISMPTYRDWILTVRAVQSVLAHTPGQDLELVVVDNGSERPVAAILTAAFLGDDRVRVRAVPRNLNFALGSNIGMAESTGTTILFLNNDTEVLDGWLAPLLAELQDDAVRGVQPLLLYPDGTIQSAGSFLPGGDAPPVALLAGLPPQDAVRAGVLGVRVATAAALAVPADEFAVLEGFDPMYVNGQEDVDYCLRATAAHGGQFRVVTKSVVIHHESKSRGRSRRIQPNRAVLVDRWRGRLIADDQDVLKDVGLRIAYWDLPVGTASPDEVRIPRPVYVRDPHLVASGPAAGTPSLRWAIKIAAHPGPRGDVWGDAHFADALASSLERLGQQVVIDRRESFERSTSGIDDVVLVIRGLEEVVVQPGRVNLLWVISHPDMVTERELRTFDRVFAASVSWARRVSATGARVDPLLQATDPLQFHPGLATHEGAGRVLFVGRSRNVLRPIVRDAVAADLDLDIFGNGWERFGLGAHVRADYLPYDQVGRAYADARVVLNDHWDDMAREGFLSNRLFDAVAAGARVVSDQVDGLDDLFGGAVKAYSSVDDLRDLCGPEVENRFPSADERHVIARRVGVEHSFDHRARSLLEAALEIRREQGWAR